MSPTERDRENGRNQMAEPRKRRSMVILILELLRDMMVFIDLEVKLAIAEFKRNIGSAKKGVTQMAIGLFLLLLALLLFTCSAVAALAIALPLWLASLIVGAFYATLGLWLTLAGKNRLSKSSPLPKESFERIRTVSRKLRG